MTYTELLSMAWALISENTAMRARIYELEGKLFETQQRLESHELNNALQKLEGKSCRKHDFYCHNSSGRCPVCEDLARARAKGKPFAWL